MNANTTIVRIQLDFPEEKVKELDELMREAEISTRKDLFNNALTLLVWAANETREGNIIVSLNQEEKTYKQLVMPILSTIARVARKHLRRSGSGGTGDDRALVGTPLAAQSAN